MTRLERNISPEDIVKFLNNLLGLENEAMQKLFSTNIPIKNENTYAVMPVGSTLDTPTMSFLGILNGLFDGGGKRIYPIGMDVGEDGKIMEFRRIESK